MMLCWRALRLQKLFDNKGSKPASHDSSASSLTSKLQDDLWSFDFEDEDDEFDLEELGKALTEATTLASASKTKNPNTCADTIEKCSPEDNYSKNVASLSTSISLLNIKENQTDGNEQAPEEAWEGESYEYDKALNADRTYLKFKKRLDVYPNNCLLSNIVVRHFIKHFVGNDRLNLIKF
nr:programmed cell death protein 2, C-terminal [Tanacetum cinerariifolium]